MDQLYIPAGASAEGAFDTVIDPGVRDGWVHTGLRIARLGAGDSASFTATGVEVMALPISGGARITVGGETVTLRPRADVFAAAPDVLYAPEGSTLEISSEEGARIALALARTTGEGAHPVTLIPAEDVPVEVRGAGAMTRIVRNFGTVGVFDDCESLIACEVITPGGNWSSYPAHKHDESTATESELEEIYYYEIQDAPDGGPGFGYHRTSSTDEQRPIDELHEVHPGDVVLVPHGWHGPCAAAPGHAMYYLNVMAGPDPVRAWNITDHPEQTWVRGTWDGLDPDPRAATGDVR